MNSLRSSATVSRSITNRRSSGLTSYDWIAPDGTYDVEAAIAAGQLGVWWGGGGGVGGGRGGGGVALCAAEELAGVAAAEAVPYLRALAGRAMGSVRLVEGDARGALVVLRGA